MMPKDENGRIDWNLHETLVDASGRYHAEILSVIDGVARMVRWKAGSMRRGHRKRFTLPEWFLMSPSCGWRVLDAAPAPVGDSLKDAAKNPVAGKRPRR